MARARRARRPRPRLTTTQRGLGRKHQLARARLVAALVDGTPCPRRSICGGLPMFATPAAAAAAGLPPKLWKLDADHVIPRALGGANGPLVLSHAHCDKAAGAALGNKLRAARRRAMQPPNGQTYTRW